MVDVASFLIVVTAFVLGLGHSLDPDHVVAVSTLICKNTSLRKSVASATAWGAGHSAILLVVGLLVLGLRVAIPESVVQLFELTAGIMLIALGILVLRPLLTHKLRHRELQEEANSQTPTSLDAPSHGHLHVHKSALTGVLQGLAGSAAIMLVTLTTVNSLELGLVFILVFGAGVILGMVSIACLISSLLNYTASRIEKVHEKIGAITGTISIGFGVFIITQILIQFHL
jgi:cytochrome c biogenesis protein CcdA